uniref:AlNc14C10G1222 protein n=1 Tax=Albugo laibachii Nc14 TaxID=890382 RepID=F0W2H1_9STRA|nr:AlNc14C10G1222 [Albugo laibachii Nc14]|eukprot:CCA15257.1 AlNc14C10G1222 [Albugo laibachii Nc14]
MDPAAFRGAPETFGRCNKDGLVRELQIAFSFFLVLERYCETLVEGWAEYHSNGVWHTIIPLCNLVRD